MVVNIDPRQVLVVERKFGVFRSLAPLNQVSKPQESCVAP